MTHPMRIFQHLRASRGILLAHVAQALGVSAPQVSRWDAGIDRMPPGVFLALVELLRPDPLELGRMSVAVRAPLSDRAVVSIGPVFRSYEHVGGEGCPCNECRMIRDEATP